MAFMLFYASYSIAIGVAGFGPRFLVPVLPILALGIAFTFETIPGYVLGSVGLLSIFINWMVAQFGFAQSILQPFQTLLTQGLTLPIFDAILTHSGSQTSSVYLFALHYHVPITIGLAVGLLALFYFTWRDAWARRSALKIRAQGLLSSCE